LWGRKKKQKSVLVFCLFLATSANAQSCFFHDSSIKENFWKKIRYEQELEYSFSVSNFLFLNWHHDKNANQVILLQNLKYKFSLSGDSLVHFSGSFQHNLGLQSYFDSLTNRRQYPEYTLRYPAPQKPEFYYKLHPDFKDYEWI
jgi:hypothetical protein